MTPSIRARLFKIEQFLATPIHRSLSRTTKLPTSGHLVRGLSPKSSQKAFDIIKSMIDVSSRLDCGTIAGMVLENMSVSLTPTLALTRGTATITFETDPPKNKALFLEFSGTFTLSIVEQEICTVDIPTGRRWGISQMEIKTNFDTSSLSTLISDVLVEYIEDLTWAVPNNPAALIVVVGAKDEIERAGD